MANENMIRHAHSTLKTLNTDGKCESGFSSVPVVTGMVGKTSFEPEFASVPASARSLAD